MLGTFRWMLSNEWQPFYGAREHAPSGHLQHEMLPDPAVENCSSQNPFGTLPRDSVGYIMHSLG